MPSFAFRTSFTTTTKKVSLPTPISQLCKARLSREEVIFQGGSRAGEGREKCTTYYPFLCDMVWLKNLKWCCIYSLLIILSWEIDVHILKAPWRGRICLKDTVLNIGLDQKICSRNYLLAVEYESNALIVKVDTNDEYEFTRDMQVRGLPTLYFISPDPNKDAIRIEGLIPTQMTRDIIDNQM